MISIKQVFNQSMVIGTTCLSVYGAMRYQNSNQISALQSQLDSIKAQEEKEKILGQYALNMMSQTTANTKLSDAKKQTLARSIVKVSNDVFETDEQKKAFIAVLAIESEFMRNAQSPTGPKGLSQVSRAAFVEGVGYCGLGATHDEDVWETDINLYAGACYFRALLETHKDPYIAIVAYNQGPNSKDSKTFAKSGRMDSIEALKYVARFNYLKRVVTATKNPLTVEPQAVIQSTSKSKSTIIMSVPN